MSIDNSNRPTDSFDDEDNGEDDALRELLSPLRSLKPSEASRLANRQLAAAAQPELLSSLKQAAVNHPISPRLAASTLMALACTLLMGVGIGWTMRGPQPDKPNTASTDKEITPAPQPAAPPNTADQMVATSTERTPVYHTSETYLIGFGTVSTSSGYYYPEN